MICSNCNNGCKKCGCKDTFVEAAPSTPTCEVVQCAAVMDANCVIYSGSPIVSGDTTIVNTGDTVSEALNEIVGVIPVPTSNVFRGLLTQSGTSAPTLVTQENSLGVTFTLARSGLGTYSLSTTSTLFIVNQSWYNIAPGQSINQSIRINLGSTTSMSIYTYNLVAGNYVLADGILSSTPVEILIYA
jgi:hypothetical protein